MKGRETKQLGEGRKGGDRHTLQMIQKENHRQWKGMSYRKSRIGLWVECRQGGHTADEHSHGMSVVPEGLHVLHQILVQVRVTGDSAHGD